MSAQRGEDIGFRTGFHYLTAANVSFMNTKKIIKITFPLILLAGIYFLGSEPAKPKYDLALPQVPADPTGLVAYVKEKESHHKIKPDNESRIEWYDSVPKRTEYAVVYVHGFSASPMEGEPTHRRFAKEFGCNLYLPRLADHGIDTTEALLMMTPDRLWESAKEALAIGKQLGDKVILMSTSTGGTLALKLAAEYPNDVYALINLSPNIAINNGAAFLLNNPWGLQIVRKVKGGEYSIDETEEFPQYWYTKYRLEATTQLEELVESTMTKDLFQRVKQPSLTVYYYKDEKDQDPTVKVSAMLEMNKALGTPDDMKEAVPIPGAGVHPLGFEKKCKDYPAVYGAVEKFALEKLKLTRTGEEMLVKN